MLNVTRRFCARLVASNSYIRKLRANYSACVIRGGREEDLAIAKPFEDMPGPKIYPFIGTAYIYRPIGEYVFPDNARMIQIDKFKKYGKIFREKIGALYFVHIYDPEDVRTMFRNEGKYPVRGPLVQIMDTHFERSGMHKGLAGDGEEQYYYRSKIQHQFLLPDNVRHHLDVQGEVADDFVSRICDILDDKKEVNNFANEIFYYACESVGAVSFDRRLNCMTDDIEPEIQEFIDSLHEFFLIICKSFVSVPWFKYFRTPMYNRFATIHESVRNLSRKYTEEATRRLQEEKAMGIVREKKTFIMLLLDEENMTPDEVASCTTFLFVAGVESTAKTLGCMLYLLATNPEAQEVLREEVQRLFPQKAPVTAATLNRMPQLKAFVKECYRVAFPTPFGSVRTLDHDVVMSGYRVPAGSLIVCNCNAALRLPDNFQDPDEFRPGRWLKKNKHESILCPLDAATLNLPFGKGMRSCLGKRFAEQEIYLALIKILQNFKVEYHYQPLDFKCFGLFTELEKPPKLRFIKI